MTFVLKGWIEHYDDKHKDWRRLSDGDAQIIRAGTGIKHAERMGENSEMFQIWLDPDLGKTMNQPPSYDDYRADAFPVRKRDAMTIKTYHGGDAPMTMVTPGIVIEDIRCGRGRHTLDTTEDRVLSAYVLQGAIRIDGRAASYKDFIVASNRNAVEMETDDDARLFVIESPAKLSYQTFAERRR